VHQYVSWERIRTERCSKYHDLKQPQFAKKKKKKKKPLMYTSKNLAKTT
jgi:hypothetical protein